MIFFLSPNILHLPDMKMLNSIQCTKRIQAVNLVVRNFTNLNAAAVAVQNAKNFKQVNLFSSIPILFCLATLFLNEFAVNG